MADVSRASRTYAILGAAFEVHATLGNGFLEAVYQEALSIELTERNIPCSREVDLPIAYRNHTLKTAYRADFICFDNVLVELKAISKLGDIEAAQVINYLKATGFEIGLDQLWCAVVGTSAIGALKFSTWRLQRTRLAKLHVTWLVIALVF